MRAHPNHEKYLNKKIEMYNEMALVVGQDMATGSFAKSFTDINLAESFEMESIAPDEVDIGKGKEASSTSMLSGKRSYRKRGCEADESITSRFSCENELYDVVMKITDFDDGILNNVFDYLVQNERLAKAFMARNEKHKKLWIEKFINEHGGSST
ncbi:unnamed protein product [Dovyalis caffra]|uniref:Uncharacterized protein n=1 Tax=Dovyalis caffra TaxID=77055 RepID=A0AAV1RX90_9ROSI|nr:unnamed protein product [Dovyalis caffra]